MSIINRQLTTAIRRQVEKYPILAVTGPRQSGKTTLLKHLFPEYQYVSLENTDLRSFATEDPVGFLTTYDGQTIFDEVQRAPELFPYLQTKVDKQSIMGQYILSGSQNFHLLERITQSLAGRVALFKLLPFDIQELKSSDLLAENWETMLFRGFYPAIYDRGIEPPVFYANYLQTHIDRDVSQLTKVQDLRRFRNFVSLCAARTGQLLNISALANAAGISQPTAKSWLTILERSFIIFLLPPYFENFSKRVVKSPKLYFFDPGLAAFLLGLRTLEDLTDRTLAGALFETLIISNIIKQNHHTYRLREYWFWRDAAGHEIDLLTQRGGSFDIFEVKAARTLKPRLFKGLQDFVKIAEGRVQSQTLIYGGADTQHRTEVKVLHWNH
ncbi:ATP-binding protein [Phaeodactylibacter xiamenensis]|uniref:ATP-binding protein n=1 Tax=Phaeodactylibacter xiamenensis TaxID=1524460 RepID=UPI003CCB9A01